VLLIRVMTVHQAPILVADLPDEPGAYVLEFALDRRIVVRAGRLGEVALGPGVLRYYGSARGPGGIRARVARHLRREGKRVHWHVDALRARADVARVLTEPGGDECRLVARDLASRSWEVAAPGFGSSDCRGCPSHLLARRRAPHDKSRANS